MAELNSLEFVLIILVAIVAILVVVFIFQYGIVCLKMLRLRLKQHSDTNHWVEQIENAALPLEIAQLLDKAKPLLTALGFHYAFAERATGLYTRDKEPLYAHIYYHPNRRTYARVLPSPLPEPGVLYQVDFTTFLTPSEVINTVNGVSYSLLSTLPWYHRYDHTVATLEQQWQAHCQTIDKADIQSQQPAYGANDYLAVQNRFHNEVLTLWHEKGWLVATDHLWRYSLGAALKLTRQFFQGYRQFQLVLSAYRRQAPATDLETQIAAEVYAFEKLSQGENCRKPYGWLVNSLLFLGGSLAIAKVMGLNFAWYTLLILLGVFLVHELMHLLGMRLLGYRDSQALLIPALAPVVTEKTKPVTPFQKMLIDLLVPISGIILSFVALYLVRLTGDSLWLDIGLIAFAFNYFTLLPFSTAVAGRRMMDTLLAVRLPRLQLLLVVASILILLVGALLLKSLFLAFLSFLLIFILIISIFTQWRWNKTVATFAKTVPHHADQKTRLRIIFQTLLQRPVFRKPFIVRFYLTHSLLRYVASPLPTVKILIFGGMIYLLTLTTPIYFVLGYINWIGFYQGISLHNAPKGCHRYREPEPDWETQLIETKSDEERWGILMAAGNWQREVGESQKARDYYQQALRVTEHFPSNDERMIDTLVKLAENASDTENADQYYTKALNQLEQHHSPNHPRIADILDDSVQRWDFSAIEVEEQIEKLERVVHIRAQHGLSQTATNASTWHRLAEFYQITERMAETEQALQRSLSIYQSLDAEQYQSYLLSGAIESLATFYFNQQRFEAAQQLLQKHLTHHFAVNPNETNHLTNHLVSLSGWAYLGQEQLSKARNAFEQSVANLTKECGTCGGTLLFYLLDLAYVELRLQNVAALNKLSTEIKAIFKDAKQGTMAANYAQSLHESLASQTHPNQEFSNWTVKRDAARLEVLQYVLNTE